MGPLAALPFESNWRLVLDAVRAAAAVDAAAEPPILLSSLPDVPADGVGAFSFVQGPPGRIVSLAIGLRAALPRARLVLIMSADSVMLGTNHLIHAARRNVAMTVLLLRSELTAGVSDGEIDRVGWRMPAYQLELENAARPLDWAAALGAAFVGRASLRDTPGFATLLADAMSANGFAVLGVTDGAALPVGVLSRTPGAEYFDEYRRRVTEPALEAARVARFAEIEADAPVDCEDAAGAPLARRAPVAAPVADAVAPAPGSPRLPRCEVRIAGLGGHGVKLAGTVLSEAAGLVEGRWATQRGEYGSATRGGPSMVDVVLGSDPITYPSADHADVLVALTARAAQRFGPAVGPGGRLVVDSDEVPSPPAGAIAIPIAALARRHAGKPIAAGMVAVGCVAALTGAVSLDSLRARIAANLPAGAVPANIEACEAGHRAALEATEVVHG